MDRNAGHPTLAEANRIINGTFVSAKRTQGLCAGGNCARCRRPGEGVPEAGRSLADALRDRLRQGVRRARPQPFVAAGAAEGQGEAALHGPRSPNCRMGRCFSRPAASSSATPRARSSAPSVSRRRNEVDDLCAIDGIHAGGFRADPTSMPGGQAAEYQGGSAAAGPAPALGREPRRAHDCLHIRLFLAISGSLPIGRGSGLGAGVAVSLTIDCFRLMGSVRGLGVFGSRQCGWKFWGVPWGRH